LVVIMSRARKAHSVENVLSVGVLPTPDRSVNKTKHNDTNMSVNWGTIGTQTEIHRAMYFMFVHFFPGEVE